MDNINVSRFEEKYTVDETTGCWLWTATKSSYGYGYFAVNRKPQLAHRVAYEIYHHPIPSDKFVLHTCNTSFCVNPDHLYLETRKSKINYPEDTPLASAVPVNIKGINVELFQEKYTVDETTGCWLWTAAQNNHGYGYFAVNRKMTLAHRVSYQLYKDEIADGLLVLHDCDTPLCVNPNHLYLGTHKDNMQDCLRRNRFGAGAPSGMHNGKAKLNDNEIAKIFELREQGLFQYEIAKQLNISQGYVSKVLRGENRIDADKVFPAWTSPVAVAEHNSSIRKGLGKGESNGFCKLTDKQVKEIFEYRATGLSQRAIAKIFSVSQSNISLILLGKSRGELQ